MRPKGKGNSAYAEGLNVVRCIPLCTCGFKPIIKLFMLKSFLSAALALFLCNAFAQVTITGFVQDKKDNKSLPGATIQVDGSGRAAVTDELGYFRIERLPVGQYTFRIKFLGYADKTETVDLSENTEVVFLLEEKPTITDEVVVTATRASDKTPVAYTTVNKQAIEKQNFGQDLPYLLNWTPSLVTTSDAGAGVGYTGLRIRGSDATRINVTINGIPYNDSESLGTFWVDIPDIASSSQSIQIQRGVGTSTNGPGAFGASINLQTNVLNNEAYGELTNSFGSFDTRRHTLSFGTGLIKDHWSVDGRVSKILSDGFIDRASADLQSYYFSGGYYDNNTVVKAILFGGRERTYQSWYGVPESRLNNDVEAMLVTAANEGWNEAQTANLLNSNNRTFNPYLYDDQVDNYGQDHYQAHLSQRIGNEFTFNTSLHYTYGRGYYEEYRYDDDIDDYGLNYLIVDDDETVADNDTIFSTDLIRRRWLDNHFYGITYSLAYETGKLDMTLGGAWNRYDGDHFGEILWSDAGIAPKEYRYYFNNGDKRDGNIFLKTNYQFGEKLNAFIDLQYRGINYSIAGIENEQEDVNVKVNYNFFNPKAGVTYSLSDNQQGYISYAIANREPVRSDFTDAPGETPEHEKLFNLEAGYRYSSQRHAFRANFYRMDYRNQLVLTGELNDVGANIRANVGESYRMGIELEGLVRLSEKVTWSGNLTLSRNKNKEFVEALVDYGENFEEENTINRIHYNTNISFSPGVIAASGLSYFPVKGAEITLLSKYVGRQYLDNTENISRSISPYFVNDLRLSYTVTPSFAREVVLSLLVNNVLDEHYASNGYTWGYLADAEYRENYYYPQAGRNFLAMVVVRL